MAHKFPEYEPFFHKGLRIEIGIPLADGDVFRDWAIVREFWEDTILVQLSRDFLPANVRVDVGTILDANVWIKEEIYSCTSIVTERRKLTAPREVCTVSRVPVLIIHGFASETIFSAITSEDMLTSSS